jgi:hypothetical protein
MHIFPQLRKLEEKYADELVVIGVHSAKFPNEKDADNVLRAAQRYELKHPVVNDAEFLVWRAYACRAWPTLMFVDPEGKVIGKHEGELPYDAFDTLLGQMIEEFDGKGMIDRRSLNLSPAALEEEALAFPGKVLADGPGNRLFIADTNHNRIVIANLDGAVQAVVGSGAEDFEDGSYEESAFNHPQGMELVDGILYVADTENHAIRRVDLERGTVDTIAGTGEQGMDRHAQGPGRQVALSSPWDLTHHEGILYIAMAGIHQLWRLSLGDGVVQPHAGTGGESIDNGPLATATLAQPSGITVGNGMLYFADSETSSIRSAGIDPATGRVATMVGIDLFAFGDRDGVEHHVRLQHPIGIEWHEGELFFADTYNHKIKRLLPLTRSVQSLLGSGANGHHDGISQHATFSEPSGLSFAVSGDGRPPLLYIADTNNHAIRVADLEADRVWTLELSGL